MKYTYIVAFLLITIIPYSPRKEIIKIIDVTQDSILIERIFYTSNNGKKQLFSKIIFNGQNQPLDSIRFLRNKNNEITTKNIYHYTKGNFENQIFDTESFNNSECEILSKITKPQFYLRDLSDICTITKAALPRGGMVSDKITIINEGNVNTIYAENIDARFKGLSLEIESYFYDQILHSFSLQIQNEKLITEKYNFEGGTLLRVYSYNAKELIVKIIVDYKNSTKETICKKYSIL